MANIGSNIYENFRMAIDTLRSNKLRSFLTIIGVVIGVITVMLMSAVISGIGLAFEEQINSFGTRSIFIYKMDIGISLGRPSREQRMRPNLTFEDAMALRELSEVETSVPFLSVSSGFFGNRTVVSAKGKQTQNIQLSGTLPETVTALGWTPTAGSSRARSTSADAITRRSRPVWPSPPAKDPPAMAPATRSPASSAAASHAAYSASSPPPGPTATPTAPAASSRSSASACRSVGLSGRYVRATGMTSPPPGTRGVEQLLQGRHQAVTQDVEVGDRVPVAVEPVVDAPVIRGEANGEGL